MICRSSIIHWRDSWIILNNWTNIFRNCAICKHGEKKPQINYTLWLFPAALEMGLIALSQAVLYVFFLDTPKISPAMLLTGHGCNRANDNQPSSSGAAFPLEKSELHRDSPLNWGKANLTTAGQLLALGSTSPQQLPCEVRCPQAVVPPPPRVGRWEQLDAPAPISSHLTSFQCWGIRLVLLFVVLGLFVFLRTPNIAKIGRCHHVRRNLGSLCNNCVCD